MTFGNDELVAALVAVSFAAGLNLYATIATLGVLARTNILALPEPIALLGNDWVSGASVVLFLIEFFADKIPIFDLVWNAVHTFVRAPAAALLGWYASSSLSPGGQLTVAIASGAIALTAHSTKVALRGAATTSPEPFSNVALSFTEDVVAIGLTWFAATHPYIAAGIAIVLLVVTFLVIRWIWRALKRTAARLRRSYDTAAGGAS